MKIFFVLAALVAVGSANPVTFGLKDDLQDFLDLVPRDKILDIVIRYLSEDDQVMKAFDYLKSDDVKSMITKVNALPEFHAHLKYLEDAGLDVYTFIKRITDLLELPEIVRPSLMSYEARATNGWRGMMAEIMAVLPVDEIKALFHEKLQTSAAFLQLFEKIQSSDHEAIVNRLKAVPEVQDLLAKLKTHGVDIQKVVEFVKKVFGWTY